MSIRTLIAGTAIMAACTNQVICAERATASISPIQGLYIAGEPIDAARHGHTACREFGPFFSFKFPQRTYFLDSRTLLLI
jgi:hypothetical protein